jgi:hypothetical protein
VQNPKQPRRTHSKTSQVLPLPFVFLTMRFEDALKSPKIDDQIFGKFGFILIDLSQRQIRKEPAASFVHLKCPIIGGCIVSRFYLQSRSPPPPLRRPAPHTLTSRQILIGQLSRLCHSVQHPHIGTCIKAPSRINQKARLGSPTSCITLCAGHRGRRRAVEL